MDLNRYYDNTLKHLACRILKSHWIYREDMQLTNVNQQLTNLSSWFGQKDLEIKLSNGGGILKSRNYNDVAEMNKVIYQCSSFLLHATFPLNTTLINTKVQLLSYVLIIYIQKAASENIMPT
jgi:hypothetical protein